MKKLLSLAAALLLFVVGAKAQRTYSMAGMTGSDTYFTYTNATYADDAFTVNAATMTLAVKNTPVSFSYTNTGSKTIFKINSNYIQADGSKATIIIDSLEVGDIVTLNIAAKNAKSGSGAVLSADDGNSGSATVEGSTDPQDVSFTATATTMEIYESNNGFRLYSVTIESGTPSLVGEWSAAEVKATVGDTNVTAPTFSVSASTGDNITSSDYSVAYSLAEGSDENIVTFGETGITAIDATAEGSATVVATVTSLNEAYESPSNTYETTITISPAATFYEQVSISDATTWDYTSCKTTIELLSDTDTGGPTTPAEGEKFLMANLPSYGWDVTFDSDFNAQALIFSGQYPLRNTGCSQGNLWAFNTTEAGYVVVKFGTTSSSNQNRYLQINDNSTVYTPTTTSGLTTSELYVSAGDVELTGTGTLRVYSIAFTPASLETKTLDVNGYTTVTSDYAFTVDGATAYTASVSGETVTLSEISGAIPAGVGVVLKGTANGTATIVPATDTASEVSSNDLIGVSDVTTALESTGTNYVLANDGTDTKFVKQGTADLSSLKYKAYINVADESAAKTLNIVFAGDATGISNVAVEAEAATGAIYNLAGQQVSESYKGVVVKNGKKYVNR